MWNRKTQKPMTISIYVNDNKPMKTKNRILLHYLDYILQGVHSSFQTPGRSLLSIQTDVSTHCCKNRSLWCQHCICHLLQMCCKLTHHYSSSELDNFLENLYQNVIIKIKSYFLCSAIGFRQGTQIYFFQNESVLLLICHKFMWDGKWFLWIIAKFSEILFQ